MLTLNIRARKAQMRVGGHAPARLNVGDDVTRDIALEGSWSFATSVSCVHPFW